MLSVTNKYFMLSVIMLRAVMQKKNNMITLLIMYPKDRQFVYNLKLLEKTDIDIKL